MALFTEIAQKFKLLPALGSQLYKTAQSKETAKRVEQRLAETQLAERPKIGEGFSGNLFTDIAEKFNLVKPQPLITGELPAFQSAKALGVEVKEKIGKPLAEFVVGTPEQRQERMSKAAKILNLPETILGAIATKTTPKEGEGLLEYLNRVPYYGDVVAQKIKEKGLVDDPKALWTISMAIGLAIPNIPGGEVAKKEKVVEEFLPTDKEKIYKIIKQEGIKEVMGEPVKIIDGVDTFIHKGTGGWVVSEVSTGRYLADSVSKEGAISKAKFNIDNIGINKFKKIISEKQLPTSKISEESKIAPELQPFINNKGKIELYHGSNKSMSKNDLDYGTFLTNNKNEAFDYANLRAKGRGGKQIVSKFEFNPNEIRFNESTNEFQYIGKSKSLISDKYPQKFYQAYNDVNGSNLTAKKIDTFSFDEVKGNVSMGLEGGSKEFDDIYNKFIRNKEIPPTKLPETEPIAGKERGFAKTVRTTPETPKAVKETLKEEPLTYTPAKMKIDLEAGQKRVLESPQKAEEFLLDVDSMDMAKSGGEITATGVELMRHYAKEKNFLKEISVVENLAEKLTKAGQEINAAKLYTQMSPEGALLKAQRIVNKFNKSKFFFQKEIKLDEKLTENIYNVADQMRKATGDMKVELGWELERLFNSLQPAGALKRISTIQTIAQLLNPKTLITRNPLGNEIFFRLERLSRYVATPIDFTKSVITGGERTITFKTIKQGEYWKNWLTGLRAGWKGASPAGLGTQFEIYAPVFKAKWNPLTYLEKTLGASLKSFDFAAYSRAKNQVIGEMGYLKALNEGLRGDALKTAAKEYAEKLDTNLLQIADNYGKYITFQDNNLVSVGLQKVKRGLNVGQDFGLGDLISKYPKTPGALLMRGLEYSIFGFLRGAYLIAKPLLKGKAVDSREVIEAVSRATVGTLGTTGLGWYLADKGIITGEAPTDKDVAAMERGVGGGQYRINLSALKRWVLSGFEDTETQKGDTMYSYDWAQPIALSLSLGANANQQMKEERIRGEKRGALAGAPSTIASSLGGAVETLTEQPVLSGLKRFFGGYDLMGSVEQTIESMPSSFTPTLLNQVRQVIDPISRETYDPKMYQRAINRVKSRIPILAKELPKKYDTLGNEIKFPQDPNVFNVFLNPGFISEYKPSDAAQLVLRIYNETGEKKQFPRVAPRSLKYQGKMVELSGKQISLFQKHIGKKTEALFGGLARKGFGDLDNDMKIKVLDYALGKIYQQERYLILTPKQKKILIESLNDKEKEAFVKDLQRALNL